MSTEITPMKRLSTGINQFRNQVKSYFNEVNLNKSAPKYNPHAWRDGDSSYSKGVENDFIMIFSARGIEPSFAISFTYINLPVEQQKVEVTIKKGKNNDSIVTSGEMTLEDFRVKLNEINKAFQEKSYLKNRDETSILEKVSEVFLSQTYDLKGEIKQATKEIKKLRETKRKEYNIENLETNVIDTTNAYDSAEKKAKRAISNSSEKEAVAILEKQLLEAKNKLAEKTKQIENKYQLNELNEEKFKAKAELVQATNQMNREVDAQIDKLPGIVSRRLKM